MIKAISAVLMSALLLVFLSGCKQEQPSKPEQAKPGQQKTEPAKPEPAKPEHPKAEPGKPEHPKTEHPK